MIPRATFGVCHLSNGHAVGTQQIYDCHRAFVRHLNNAKEVAGGAWSFWVDIGSANPASCYHSGEEEWLNPTLFKVEEPFSGLSA